MLLYTTDPPSVIEAGTLKGEEVYSVVDFGPGWIPIDLAFRLMDTYNPPGESAV